MSDQRPIEEVIGWEREPGFGWFDARRAVYHRRAEVDDLAAWLDATISPGGWDIERTGKHGEWAAHNDFEPYWHTGNLVGWVPLREALVAAVRKVDAS